MKIVAKNKLFRYAFCVLLIAVSCIECFAAGPAETIAPFIDEQTLAVVRVDFSKIELDPLFNEAGELVPEVKPYLAPAKAAAGGMLAMIRQAGGREVYYVVTIAGSLADADMIFVVAPLDGKDDVKTLTTLLKQQNPRGFTAIERIGNCLVAGSDSTVARLKTLKPDNRPELKAAFDAGGDAAATLLLLPPHYFRRIIVEMMPTLPDEFGGGSSQGFSDGFSWATIAVDAPPKTALRATIKSRDAESAQSLLDTWRRIYPLLLRGKDGQKGLLGISLEMSSDMEKLIELLMPKVEGDRLVLALNKDNGGIKTLVDVSRPLVISAQRADQRAATMNNSRQIVLATINYEMEKGVLPADIYAADGTPLLSWRVHLLPYLGHEELYKKFKLDEPWDGPNNIKLLVPTPPGLFLPASAECGRGATIFLRPLGKGTAFDGKQNLKMKDIKSVHDTIMFVEAVEACEVPWTKPADLPYDLDTPTKGLIDDSREGFIAAFFDGHTEIIPKTTDAERLRKMFEGNAASSK